MNSNAMQPSSGRRVEMQRVHHPRQMSLTGHRQPQPITNTTGNSHTQDIPGPSQSLTARSTSSGRPKTLGENAVSSEGQRQKSELAPGTQPKKRPQAVGDAMRGLTISRRGNRPPRRSPQHNGFTHQDMDQEIVPALPNASTSSQHTRGLPQDRSEASTSYSSQSSHNFPHVSARAQNGASQHGSYANGMQLLGQQHPSGLAQQPRHRQGPPLYMQQPLHGSQHPAGMSQSHHPPPAPSPLQQRQAHDQLPHQIRRPSQMRPRRLLPDSRRLRGERPGPSAQGGGEESHGRTNGDAAASEPEDDVPACVICTGPQSVCARMCHFELALLCTVVALRQEWHAHALQ